MQPKISKLKNEVKLYFNNEVNEITQKNKESIEDLANEVRKFKT